MPIPLQESIGLVKSLRDENSDSVAHLNDQELAELAYNQTQDERLLPAASSNALQRGINTVGQAFKSAGHSVESAIADPTSPYLQRLGGRVAGNIVGGLPEMATMVASSRLRGLPSVLTALGGAGYVYGRNKAETGDSGAAAGEAVGTLASLVGGIGGGRFAAGKVAGPVAKTVAGSAGAIVGSMPGDYVSMVSQPGETLDLKGLREDELGIPAYLLGQVAGDVPIHLVDKAASLARGRVEARKAKTVDLDASEVLSDADRYVQLNKKPVPERSELDLAEMQQIARRLGKQDEAMLADKSVPPPSLDKLREPESALRSQIWLLNKGKKAVVEVPIGQEIPHMESYQQAFSSHTSDVNGHEYLYDETKTNPAQIDNAIKTNSLGHLLGYGVPSAPAVPSGEVAVLRGPKGNEKVSVLLSHDTKPQVLKALGEMAMGEDKVNIERPEQVMKWRQENSGLQKLYSISGDESTTPEKDISFTNNVLDMFEKSMKTKLLPKYKGAKFQLDEQGNLGSKGLLKAVQDWAPAELWEHYKSRGIETLLNSDKVQPNVLYTVFGPEYGKRTVQLDHIANEGRGEPMTDQQRASYPQPPADLPTGQYVNKNGKWEEVPRGADLSKYASQPGKVSAQDFTKWLRENTPEVEVKKLVPPNENMPNQREALSHQLETRGFHVSDTGDLIYRNGQTFDLRAERPVSVPEDVWNLARQYESAEVEMKATDAATGRYGVEPKDLSDMPGAVDILVRVPSRVGEESVNRARYDADERQGVLHRGPHFGESDTNVLASVRGYMETLPSGEKVFHVFEVQSDWGQDVRKRDEMRRQNEERGQANGRFESVPDHPLLAHYETLALKTAIQHARAEGATHVAISDAETAMMTEGHDRVDRTPQNFGGIIREEGTGKLPLIPQEKGMRAAYDQRLPAIMKKLSGESGQRIDFGRHKESVLGSPVFKDSDGKSKTNVTARLYDITNPSESVKRLFSIYDAQEQTNFEQNAKFELDKLDQGLRDPQELTPAQLLERAVQGDKRVGSDALTNFLAAIRGTRGALRMGTFLSPEVSASMDVATHDIKFNKDLTLRVNEAFSKLTHELTHGAILDMGKEEYAALNQQVNNIGQAGRQSILESLARQLKMGKKFDANYLSGARFDPNDPHFSDRVTHEFSAGLMELAAESHFQKNSTSAWMQYLPAPVQRLLSGIITKLKSLFSGELPSVSALLSPAEAGRLNGVVDSLQRSVISAERANLSALLNLKKSSSFDESTFVDRLVDSKDNFKSMPTGGDGELYSLAKELYDGVADPIKKRYENLFFPAMWRSRNQPETAGHFNAMHGYRPANIADSHSFLAYLGQNNENSFSREQAIENWGKFAGETLFNTGQKGARFRDSMGKIQEENQNRREASTIPLTDADLVTGDEMVKDFGLDPAHVDQAKRLIKVSQLVAEESQKKARQVDTINLTRMFYGANKAQDIEGVRQKVSRMNRATMDAGDQRLQLEWNKDRLEKLRKRSEPDLEMEAEVQQEIQKLQVSDELNKTLIERIIRQEFSGAIPMKPDGPDPFVNRMTEFMIALSARRRHVEIMTKSAGWASMTRRGRFRLRVKDNTDLGEEMGTVKEYRGFQTEKEMNDYIAKEGYTDDQIEKFDMSEIKDRVRAYSPSGIERAQKQAHAQFDQAIAEVEANMEGLPPEAVKERMQALADMKSSFNPLEQEMKDVISVKGDKFAEKRRGIAGYNTDDFLPNTFEYMQYKTVAGNKAIAQAESNLQIGRRELDNQPDLRDRMKREQQYVLSNQDEWNAAKKLVFYYYLGASPRHILQNAVQIPLNGISQMVAEGSGLAESYKHFGKAAALAAQYARKGTTGDHVVDTLLKQADKDGISFSTAIEAPIHESHELQNILDSINAHADGKVGFGTRISLEGTKLWKGFEKFLQATSVAAESANRKTTFIASILADRAKGEGDSRTLYNKASQFTNFVNFVGDKPNRPGYMIEHGNTPIHGPLGLATALQSFTLNHIAQLYSFYNKGFKQGSVADKRAFAVGLAHLLAFSGSLGMVGAATAEQLFEEMTGVSLKTALRSGMVDLFGEGHEMAADRASDAVMGGFPALMGVDSTSSIGLGSPGVRYQAGEPLTLEQLGGPAVGMAGRVATAVGKVTEDPFNPQAWWDATRSASPSFLTHAIRVYDLLNRSSTLDKNQQPITDPLSAAGSAAAVAGFTPMETAKQRELNTRIYRETKKSAADYERNVLRISQLLFSAEQTGDQSMIDRAKDMMAKYVDSVGQVQDRDAMVHSITDQLQQMQGKVTPAASLKDSETRQKLERAFPSVVSRSKSAVDTAFLETEVAQWLGQDDVLARTLMSLPTSLQDKAITDALTASGIRPEEVQQFLQPNKMGHLGPP